MANDKGIFSRSTSPWFFPVFRDGIAFVNGTPAPLAVSFHDTPLLAPRCGCDPQTKNKENLIPCANATPTPSVSPVSRGIIENMTMLSIKEAEEARQRRLAYENDLAIEGIFLTPDEKRVFERIHQERMGHEDALRFVIDWCRNEGLIPERDQAAE